MLKETWSD